MLDCVVFGRVVGALKKWRAQSWQVGHLKTLWSCIAEFFLCLLGKTNDLEESGTALFWACSQTLHGQGPEITSCEPLVQVIQLTMRVDSDVELRCS